VRAFRSVADFAGNTEESFSRWLAGIAHHAVIDQARHLSARKHDYRREVPLPAEPTSEAGWPAVPVGDLASPAPSPSGVLRRKERLDRLLDAIQALSPDHRQVILLTRIEQLPVKEVARRMGRSEKAISMLLLRAMMALRSVFGETDSLSLPAEPDGPDRDGSRGETGRAP
jgi:RNA polymerase sigma-70 factor, ECF subfamily